MKIKTILINYGIIYVTWYTRH